MVNFMTKKTILDALLCQSHCGDCDRAAVQGVTACHDSVS